jgi:hypothetical protein
MPDFVLALWQSYFTRRTTTAAEVLRSGASVSDSAEEDLAHYRVTRPRGTCDSLESLSSTMDVR